MSFNRTQISLLKKPKFSKTKIKKKQFSFKRYKSIKFIFVLLILAFLITFKDIKKRKAFDEFKPHKVFIEAHRGVHKEILENTKEPIELAIKYGFDSFETDLWLTNDNVGVLVHGGPYGDISYYYNTSYQVMFTNQSQLSTLLSVKDKLKMPRLDDIM